jgi:ribonuclease P protein component
VKVVARGVLTPHYFLPMIQKSPAQRLRFNRAARIKQGRDFAKVHQEGERSTTGCLIANWRKLPTGSGSRLGVITAGKIGNAVVRSRARRLLRETFRLHQNDLSQPVELVLVARPSIVGKGFAEVEKDFLTTLRKSGLLRGDVKTLNR